MAGAVSADDAPAHSYLACSGSGLQAFSRRDGAAPSRLRAAPSFPATAGALLLTGFVWVAGDSGINRKLRALAAVQHQLAALNHLKTP